jgi:hypothetical protein
VTINLAFNAHCIVKSYHNEAILNLFLISPHPFVCHHTTGLTHSKTSPRPEFVEHGRLHFMNGELVMRTERQSGSTNRVSSHRLTSSRTAITSKSDAVVKANRGCAIVVFRSSVRRGAIATESASNTVGTADSFVSKQDFNTQISTYIPLLRSPRNRHPRYSKNW